MVGIGHDLDVVAEGLAHEAHALDVVADRQEADLHLSLGAETVGASPMTPSSRVGSAHLTQWSVCLAAWCFEDTTSDVDEARCTNSSPDSNFEATEFQTEFDTVTSWTCPTLASWVRC